METIIQKAIAREPEQRYATAGAMAEDLRRFLDGRTILARRASLPERVVRWCRRNPWVAASIVILLVGTVVSVWQAFRATKAERTARSAAEATITALSKAESEAIRATRAEAATGIQRDLAQAEAKRAIQAEAATRTQRDRAQVEAERFKAVSEFLRKDLLAQASTYNQAGVDSNPDPDLKVRTALDRAASKIGDRFAGQTLVEASIRQTIGETYYQLGLFSQARPHLERAIELRRNALSAEDTEIFLAMNSLGVLLADDGKWTEAERYLVPAMEGLLETRGADALETLEAMLNVANLYGELKKGKDAETLLSDALKGFQRTRGARDHFTLRTMDNLAVLYHLRKKPVEAEQLEKEVVRSLQEEVGTDHPYTLTASRNLATIYAANGRKPEAEQLWKDVLRDQRRVLGDKHPETLYTLAVFAEYYMYQGKLDEVERYAGEALEGARTMLNDKHQIRAAALAFLANVYGGRADLNKLEPVLIESVEIARFRWGTDNSTIAQGDGAVALLLIYKGEYARAEPYCREQLAFRIKDHPGRGDRFWSELHLGIALLGQKRFAEAEPHLRSAHNGLKPRAKSDTPADNADLGWIIEQIKRLRDESGNLFREASLAKLRGDPALQAIVFDLQFPADPFAPKSSPSPGRSGSDHGT